jgi:hypothetical protein
MGTTKSIYELEEKEFIIQKVSESKYFVCFDKDKSRIWEEYICKSLDVNYWNEYLAEDHVVFLFHLVEGFKRYEVYNYDNLEVLKLCEKLCDCKFDSLKSMLEENTFYSRHIK